MKLAILGTRGVPASHGGFETFAEALALYLVGRGWEVTVYCQEDGVGEVQEDEWCGIRRVIMPIKQGGALGTIIFDWRSIWHLLATDQKLVLTLGYNTAVFCAPYRLYGIRNLINMDGIEWRRQKWSFAERAWFWLNERLGCFIGNHLIADHPEIANHLSTRISRNKITMIPYGAQEILSAEVSLLAQFGIEQNRFVTVIARPEPENSILEIVRAFSQKRRNRKLVMLGCYEPEKNAYHADVLAAASDEVLFPGAIYDKRIVEVLRFYSRLYIHGHQVGGTNPSLVEAMGAGSAVLAHDNRFNRWVAGGGASYFENENECAERLSELLDEDSTIERMRLSSRVRFNELFTWENVLGQYERLLTKWG
ncbi:MAG TPA: DUF1972 domain-containing protein [Gallionella sp.]|nr:DUF1972 domain-containing protein [Gallionella sp.]